MSEYQYYEFRAIDRALTDRHMRELRAISTRAAISRTSFSNYYTYGGLKANPRDLLEYFDASLYFANWLFLEVAFRYPKGAVDVKALRHYAAGHTLEIRSTGQHVVVAIPVESDGESFDPADDGSGWLSSLIGLRADLASGDERVLYLGWLLDVQCGGIDDDAVEPPRPEGLGNLSPALESLVEIIGLDRNLVTAAEEGAPPPARQSSTRDVNRWLTARHGRARRVTRACRSRRRPCGSRAHAPIPAVHATSCASLAVAHRRRAACQGGGDAKLLESVKPGKGRSVNAKSRPLAIDTSLIWRSGNAWPGGGSTRSSGRDGPATTTPRWHSSRTCAT